MPAFQFFNPAPVFLDLLAIGPLSDGGLYFTDIGTTNPRNTWSNPALSILNSNPVLLDASGRAETQIFLDGEYTATCKAGDGTVIWTRDIIPGGDASLTIPSITGKEGQFLSTDGTNLVWQDIVNRLLPDATDSSDQYPVTVDGGYQLRDIPTTPDVPEPDISIDTVNKTVTTGTSSKTTKFRQKFGNGTAPASFAKGTSVDIEFGFDFLTVWKVDISPRIGQATPSGALVDWSITDQSNSGCTVNFNVSDDDNNSAWMIDRAIDFDYEAKGTFLVSDEDD